MNLSWDRNQKQWFHSFTGRNLTFGGEKQSVPYKDLHSLQDHLTFTLRIKHNHLGPLVGILCGRKADLSLTGNGPLFKNLQHNMLAHGGISFVFTPEDVNDSFINGYIYLPEQNSWLKVQVPFPDIVYNRIPFRKIELSPLSKTMFQTFKEKDIPFFNPSFIDKYDLFHLFQSHPFLKKYLPDTLLITEYEGLLNFILKYTSIYLKPCVSSKGKGIYRLKKEQNGNIHVQSINGILTFENLTEFWKEWHPLFLQKRYLAQESISFSTYNGQRFDFRILCHGNGDQYVVSGVALRQSQTQDLTTHLPNGGICLPYELVQTTEHDNFIHTIAFHIGQRLSEKLGYFGEFSIDAGVSSTGQYYIYEVNSKPMRFEEVDIEENKIKHLCRLFLQLSSFKE